MFTSYTRPEDLRMRDELGHDLGIVHRTRYSASARVIAEDVQ